MVTLSRMPTAAELRKAWEGTNTFEFTTTAWGRIEAFLRSLVVEPEPMMTREELARVIENSSKFPLPLKKGTNLLEIRLREADAILAALQDRAPMVQPDQSAIRAAKREALEKAIDKVIAVPCYECAAKIRSLIAALEPKPCEHEVMSGIGHSLDSGVFFDKARCIECGMVRTRGWTSDWHEPESTND